MAVIQVPMMISEKAHNGLMAGELVLSGGVIRDKGGHIFEHLKNFHKNEGENTAQQVASKVIKKPNSASKTTLFDKAGQYVIQNKGKTGLIVGSVIVTSAGVVYGIQKFVDKQKEKRQASLSATSGLNTALNSYINAARNGELRLDHILNLKEHLSLIRNSSKLVVYTIDAQQLVVLMELIIEYTQALAVANDFPMPQSLETQNLLRLEEYLSIQQDIFEKAV